jgi:hypothetical protein
MAIELNSSALNAFRELHLENANAIINVDGEGLKQNGTYSGALSSLSRSKETQAENNAARTALLKALGRAFNVKGMNEVDGKVTFTKDFMDRLETILGKDFKRGDFKLTANGEVASGRPLTMRRIDAIVKKADLVGAGTFSVDVYRRKFELMLKDMGAAKMSPDDMKKKGGEFITLHNIAKILTFLEKEADKSVRVNPEYEYAREVHEFENDEGEPFDEASFKGPRFEYLDASKGKDGEYVPLRSTDDWVLYVSSRAGVVFHPERCRAFSKENYASITELNKYLSDNLKLYVKKAIDNFFAAQNCGKMGEYTKVMGPNAGVCLEEKCMRLVEFEDAHLVEKDAMDVAEAEALRRIAEAAPDNGEIPSVENLVYKEIEAAFRLGEQYANSEDWNDFAALVKEHLVGTTATIMQAVLEGDEYKFEPVMADGKPVVRPLTAADIDAIGPACMAKIMGF